MFTQHLPFLFSCATHTTEHNRKEVNVCIWTDINVSLNYGVIFQVLWKIVETGMLEHGMWRMNLYWEGTEALECIISVLDSSLGNTCVFHVNHVFLTERHIIATLNVFIPSLFLRLYYGDLQSLSFTFVMWHYDLSWVLIVPSSPNIRNFANICKMLPVFPWKEAMQAVRKFQTNFIQNGSEWSTWIYISKYKNTNK